MSEDTSELENMHLLLTVPSKTPFPGRYSSVSIHPTQNIVVCVYDAGFPDQQLYYSVGTVNKENGETTWGPACEYDTGSYPSVALSYKGANLYVIATHVTGFLNNQCCCRVGIVNRDQMSIEWGSTKELCQGEKPKVCANDDGTVIIVHEENHLFWGDKLRHDILKVNTEEKTLEYPRGIKCAILDQEGVEPNVAISEEKVVMVYRSGICTLNIAVGELRRDQTRIEWNNSISPKLPFTGKEPSVSINSHGNIIESHQTTLTCYRQICHNYGHTSGDEITWKVNDAYTLGEYPSISLADDGCVVEMHKTNFGANLYQSQGELKNQV